MLADEDSKVIVLFQRWESWLGGGTILYAGQQDPKTRVLERWLADE